MVLRSRAMVPRLLGLLAWVVAAVVVVSRVRAARDSPFAGKDLDGLYLAGQAALHGRPVYGGTGLAYPPTAAFVAAPLSALGRSTFVGVVTWAEALGVALLAAVTARSVARPWAMLLGAALAVVLLRSDEGVLGLAVGNISLLLVQVAAAVVVLLSRGRARTAVSLLTVSLLVKPLLLPLGVLPLLVGRARLVLVALAIGGLALAAVLLVGGGSAGLGSLLHFLAYDNLKGQDARYNLSLSGLGLSLGWGTVVTTLLRVLVAGAVMVTVVVVVRRDALGPAGVVVLAGAVELGVLLVGPFNEIHYLFLLVLPTAVTVTTPSSWPVRAVLTVATVALFLPSWALGISAESWADQVLLVTGQVVVLVCFLAVLLTASPAALRDQLRGWRRADDVADAPRTAKSSPATV